MSVTSAYDIIIIGGGAIGLSLAWRLQQGGLSIAVLERGRFLRSPSDIAPEGQATIAAAGMLAPFVGASAEGPLLQLALQSFRLWPAFTEELSHSSEVEVPIEGEGVLRFTLANKKPADNDTHNRLSDADNDTLDSPEHADNDTSASYRSNYDIIGKRIRLQESHGFPLYHLTQEQVRELEPAVRDNMNEALFSPLERQVQPRRLLRALTRAVQQAGGQLYDDAPIDRFTFHSGEILSVETAAGSFQAGQYVLAGGAWTGLLAEKLNVKVPMHPVRGQMLALDAPGLINHAIFAPGGCLIPQTNGLIMVGSTEEDAGFQSCNTAEGIQQLLRFATKFVPALAGKPLHSTWAGLRPAAADGLPVLGAVPGWDNLHLASGHFRKGILLTPITARWMANLILRGEIAPGMEAFSPKRFIV